MFCQFKLLIKIGPAPADVVEASSDRGHWSAKPMRYQTHKRALFDRVVVVYTVLPVPLPNQKVLACVWFWLTDQGPHQTRLHYQHARNHEAAHLDTEQNPGIATICGSRMKTRLAKVNSLTILVFGWYWQKVQYSVNNVEVTEELLLRHLPTKIRKSTKHIKQAPILTKLSTFFRPLLFSIQNYAKTKK